MISRVLKRTLNTVKLGKKSLNPATSKLFSSEYERNKANLNTILIEELEHERDEYIQDDSLIQYLNDNGWTLTESETSNLIKLTKNISGTAINVLFTSRSPQSEVDFPEEDEEGEEMMEENMQDFDFDLCEFTVYVEKNPNEILAIEALTLDGEMQINCLNVIDDIAQHRALNPFSNTLNSYRGPEFGTLDENLQYATMDYIKSLGVDEEFAALVEHMSLDKEQRLYMKWLEDLNKFVN